jgi:hypothetical protein
MAARKKAKPEKTLLEKIGEQATHLKEEIIEGKNLFVEAATEKIAAVKKTIAAYKASKKPVAKKAVKKAAKKVAEKTKKAAVAVKKKAAKKIAPVKKKLAKKAAPKKKAAKK